MWDSRHVRMIKWCTTVILELVEEDKNKARLAWTNGPDGSISMGQRKDKHIPCVEHYIK